MKLLEICKNRHGSWIFYIFYLLYILLIGKLCKKRKFICTNLKFSLIVELFLDFAPKLTLATKILIFLEFIILQFFFKLRMFTVFQE